MKKKSIYIEKKTMDGNIKKEWLLEKEKKRIKALKKEARRKEMDSAAVGPFSISLFKTDFSGVSEEGLAPFQSEGHETGTRGPEEALSHQLGQGYGRQEVILDLISDKRRQLQIFPRKYGLCILIILKGCVLLYILYFIVWKG